MNHNHLQLPREAYEALRRISPDLAARVLEHQAIYETGTLNWVQDFLAGGANPSEDDAAYVEYAAIKFALAAEIFRPSAWRVALDLYSLATWNTWLTIGILDPRKGEADAIMAARRKPNFPEFTQAVSDIRRSPAWTPGFRPPWPAIVAVARCATLLSWPMRPEPAEPTPVAEPVTAPAAEPTVAPAAEPTAPPATAAPAAPAARRPRKRAR